MGGGRAGAAVRRRKQENMVSWKPGEQSISERDLYASVGLGDRRKEWCLLHL